ncbi:MAG: tetratricopeptide repeat protein, partial [Planctomycetes bacterium]|nr:tetratricopeptide repeat protein [Planctomycetota bacterium]
MGRRGGGSNSKIFLIVAGVIALGIGVGAVLVVRRNQSAPYRIKKLKAEVSVHVRRGKPELAAKKLEELLALDPDDVSQAVLLAQLYRQLDEDARAEALLRDHLQRAPEDLSLAIALGELLLAEGRLPEVLALLGPKVEGLKEHPDVAERSRALILLGQSHTLAGDPLAALPLLDEAVKLRETYGLQASKLETGDTRVSAQLALGDALVAAGRWAEAERILRQAYQAARDGIEINLALAHVLDRGGRTEEAVALLERLFAERKESRAEVLPRLGNFLIRIDQTGRVEALAASLDSQGDPTSEGMAAYLRGLVALDAGQLLTAERQLTRMAELLPSSLPARLLLARVALLAGSFTRAEAAYGEVLELAPANAEAELGMLALEEDAGRWAAAEARARRLLERSVTRPAAASLLLRRVAAGQDPGPVLSELDRLREARSE